MRRGSGNTVIIAPSVDDCVGTPRLRGERAQVESIGDRVKGTPPHARGTHGRHGRCEGISMGTPPRMRGTQLLLAVAPGSVGNTPACAGNTRCAHRRGPCGTEHPHMRGEHLGQESASGQKQGTPPHARGTLCVAAPVRGYAGNTPACAGNTLLDQGFSTRCGFFAQSITPCC